MQLPILYKKTSTGKIQLWNISVYLNIITSISGQVDGKKITSKVTVKSGKNVGKKNETTKEEQAAKDAKSKWDAKVKKGYVESIEDAEQDKTSDVIKGGFLPTLAHSFEKRSRDIEFPCRVQPKLDGIRCTFDNGKLWTRSRKEIISVPHILKAIVDSGYIGRLDGELYNHDLKDEFETITRIAGQKKTPEPDHEKLEYHVYDLPIVNLPQYPFDGRFAKLGDVCSIIGSPLVLVETDTAIDRDDLADIKEGYLDRGYEGAMVRNIVGPYEYKRSRHLQKVKDFEDAEFEIVDVKEGKGKLENKAGSFTCITEAGDQFDAKMKGKLADLEEYFVNKHKYIGQQLTVQFQGYTNKNNVPRFPVGLRLHINI